MAGRIFCNLDGLNVTAGEKVRWHTIVQVHLHASKCKAIVITITLGSAANHFAQKDVS